MAGYARLAGLQANNLGAQLELERLRQARQDRLFSLLRGVSGDLTSAATQAVGAYQAGQERDAALGERKRQEGVRAAEAEKDRQARLAELRQRAEDARGLASAKADARAALQRERLAGRAAPAARTRAADNGMPAQPVDAEAQAAAARARMAQQMGGSRRGREVLNEDVARLSQQYGMDPALVEGRILASIRSLEAAEAEQMGAEEEAERKGLESQATVGLRGAQTGLAQARTAKTEAETAGLPEERELQRLDREIRQEQNTLRRQDLELKRRRLAADIARRSAAASKPREGKPLPVQEAGRLGSFKTAEDQLAKLQDFVEKNPSAVGPVAGRAQKAFAAVGGGTETYARFNALRTAALQTAGRLLEGGKLTDDDFQRYRAAFASETTSPDNLAAAIGELRAAVREAEASERAQLQGYNVPPQPGETAAPTVVGRLPDGTLLVQVPGKARPVKLRPDDPRAQKYGLR